MFEIDKKTGNITLRQGDSFNIPLEGLPTDREYEVYFAAQDLKRRPVGDEIHTQVQPDGTAMIEVSGEYSKQYLVGNNYKSVKYPYGIKLCHAESGYEDTLILGEESDMFTENYITVLPLKVEGI